MVKELAPQELQARLAKGESIVLLDVREAEEVAFVQLPGALHIPLAELPARWQELDSEAEIVVYCHHGIRSAAAAAFLSKQGFPRVANLRGGIDAWALVVDPSLPRY
jgi:adenylyltransferase/sulfurtransferase